MNINLASAPLPTLPGVVLVALLALTPQARATTIYSDTLTGSAPANGSGFQTFSGTKPTIDSTNAYWNVNGAYAAPSATVNGMNSYRYNNSQSFTAQLPISIDSTSIYTLSVDISYPATTNDFEFGFLNSSQATSGAISDTNAAAVMVVKGGSTLVDYGFQNNRVAGTTFDKSVTHTFSIALDSASGTVTFAKDGTVYATETNILTQEQMQSISAIGLGGYYTAANCYYSNLLVTQTAAAIPEPSSWGLLLGGLSLLAASGPMRKFGKTKRSA